MHLGEWLTLSTKDERNQLAEESETTVEYLYQLGGRHRDGSAKLIKRIAEASAKVTPHRLISKHEMLPEVFDPDTSDKAA